MDQEQLCYLSIEELAPRLRAKDVSPVEVTEAALARLEALEPKLNAFVTVMGESAMVQAREAEREIAAGHWRGPLHGVPISLKDLYDTAGIRTTASSRVMANRVPARDATVTARLKDAGAVIIGKNNMFEFAYGHVHPDYGPSYNPWSLAHSTGGSSSGSGAAVAAGIGYGSMGSDTGGSIRLPASFCGLIGLKPTYGRVPRTGVVALSWSLDHCGPMTRTAWDCAAMLQAIAGYDAADPGSGDVPVPDYLANLDGGVAGLRIGIPRAHLDELDPEVEAAFDRSVAALRRLGADVRDITPPDGDALVVANMAIITAEAASFHAQSFRERPGDYSDATRDRIEAGTAMLATDLLAAQRARRSLIAEMARAMADLDLLVLPTATLPPGTIDAFLKARPMGDGGDPVFRRGRMTSPYNLTGLPAISVPNGFTQSGLPIGLQFVGHPWQDALTLRAARAIERAQPLGRRPAIG